MQDLLARIGNNIKKSRIKKSLSQGDLAKILKVDKAYISRIENGKKNLTIKSLSKLANALAVSMKNLI